LLQTKQKLWEYDNRSKKTNPPQKGRPHSPTKGKEPSWKTHKHQYAAPSFPTEKETCKPTRGGNHSDKAAKHNPLARTNQKQSQKKKPLNHYK